ncbi:MAG: Glycosyl transferase, group 1 [candidate division CPR1 bacterium GW2011_GWA2_42_17]|uniref:Glycosyl transferase, group 1 n=1 Tax=candidate division CPR1 bacterium GW2011_GWA2_42_17 TaxID=1618341 RepID=A0A0G0Z5J3_9BACT|nr:MAG: Glycosyl transferase, group 1 [candidate division CPR1 bacterium GW2011_GWA2_42_17]
MKIAIDFRDYTCGIKRGIYFYAFGLYQALAKYDPSNRYLTISDYPLKNLRDKNRLFGRIWDRLILPTFVGLKNIDILHFTSPNETDFDFTKAKLFKNVKTIATIHDIIPYLFPEKLLDPLPQNIRQTFEAQFQMALKADHLIAISRVTKNDLIKTFNIDPNKISVVYQCNHDDRFRPRNSEEIEFIHDKYHLPKNFIFNPSGKDFHKNFDNIALAYSLLPNDLMEKHSLIVQGYFPEAESKRRKELCQKLGISQNVIITDVSEEDVPLLYNAARLTLTATFYEGFGLSPLESFTSGTAVIAGNNSSQPEVCEDAAVLVDAYDPESITQGLVKILADQSFREKLINKGFSQAKKFSQEIRAKETIKVYQKVLKT